MTTAMVVVDLQNDFRAAYPGDLEVIDRMTANVARAVSAARGQGIEVIFVRFLGDAELQRPSWRRRDALAGKSPKCLDGTRGAEFHQVSPLPSDPVFTKHACFDAFLAAGFEPHLRRHGIDHLVVAGLFTDVCVDSTVRTAFQKGLHITVLTDCTISLHLSDHEILRFMKVVYGARLNTHDEPETWSSPQDQEALWDAATPAYRSASD